MTLPDDKVKIIFECSRHDYAMFKYVCIKQSLSIKEALSVAMKQITIEFMKKDKTKNLSQELSKLNPEEGL